MCLMVYVASDVPLERVPWDDARPGFHVQELLASDDGAREHFGMPHVVYAGAYEGCGCGFQAGEYPDRDEEELKRSRDCLAEFSAYFERQIRRSREVQIFRCWDGEQPNERCSGRTITPSMLRRADFFFERGERVRVGPDIF